ncbi:hypothetical protein RvY_17058-2 [Ramazzottius varieornatus]|nr:hypothetical protein RvY_17058-2 [Ramazzottius varieornatus]
MPFAATNDFFGAWTLGAIPCHIWTVLDVCLCTASILHLVAIAMDRYFSITNVRYIQGRSVRLMYIVLALIWFMSLVLAVGPALGWRDDQYYQRIEEGACLVSQDLSFQIFGTTMAFYAPLSGILVLYGLIFRQTRSRVRKRMDQTLHSTLYEIAKTEKDQNASGQSSTASLQPSVPESTPPATPSGRHSLHSHSSYGSIRPSGRLWSCFRPGSRWTSQFRPTHPPPRGTRSGHKKSGRGEDPAENQQIMLSTITENPAAVKHDSLAVNEAAYAADCTSHMDGSPEARTSSEHETALVDSPTKHNGTAAKTKPVHADTKRSPPRRPAKLAKKLSGSLAARHRTLLKREKKAATTLAVITLSFIVCWLPFFLYAIIRPICEASCQVSHTTESFFLWLGYANSTLNPFIYTIFSPDFRQAFKKMFRLDKT